MNHKCTERLPCGKLPHVPRLISQDLVPLIPLLTFFESHPPQQNVLAAKAPNEEITFVHPDDLELFKAWDQRAFELQVANHELLGHGSGKLFTEDAEGKLNFDPAKVLLFSFFWGYGLCTRDHGELIVTLNDFMM